MFHLQKVFHELKGIVSIKYQVCNTLFFMDRKIQINKSQDNDVPVIVSFVTFCILTFSRTDQKITQISYENAKISYKKIGVPVMF